MSNVHDRVKETTTVTGTGAATLLGAVTQFKTFTSRYALNENFEYAIVGQTGSEWETGYGYLSATNILVRAVIFESSNADAAVNFSAGTKDIFITVIADRVNKTPTFGQVTASMVGLAMP